jgi:hypothetical protein
MDRPEQNKGDDDACMHGAAPHGGYIDRSERRVVVRGGGGDPIDRRPAMQASVI